MHSLRFAGFKSERHAFHSTARKSCTTSHKIAVSRAFMLPRIHPLGRCDLLPPCMSDSPQYEDQFQHLPTAGGEELDARAAKAQLWKQIAQQRKQSRSAPAEPEPPAEEPAPEAPRSSRDEWDELFAMDAESLEPSPAPIPAAPPAPAARKRSVIRRSMPLVVPTDETFIPEEAAPEPERIEIPVQEVKAEPQPQPEPVVTQESPAPKSDAKPETEVPSTSESSETKDDKADTPKPPPAPADKTDSEKEIPFLLVLIQKKWVQWGGASLSLSLGIHALILGIGGFLVVNQVMLDQAVDFLPGGTQQGQQASQALEHKIQQKKNPWLKKAVPMRKLAAVGSISDIVLPDEVPDILDLPSSNDMLTSAKLGGSGLGGGGFGKGMGLGAKSGMVFQPLSMFGREIKAKRLALILDVSSSMAPHLPRVIAEVDKVARGSVVVLFPGCGLDSPPKIGLEGEQVFRTNGAEFERFWRMGGMASYEEARKFKFSRSDPISSESIYLLLSKRPQTHFIHYVGIGYAWTALLSEQVRQADALYWFSDFQDHVDFQQLEIVRENLIRRKQKLYIQPYMHGSAFDLVKNQLVDPTGGEVIEANLE
jgi:hypothetical protein